MSSHPNLDTLINIKINYGGQIRRHEMLYRDLITASLPEKLRQFLNIPSTSEIRIERYSDTQIAHVLLDPKNSASYRKLYRAAAAKLKLRLKVTRIDHDESTSNITAINEVNNSSANLQIPSNTCQKISLISNTSILPTVCLNDKQKISDPISKIQKLQEKLASKVTYESLSASNNATSYLNGTSTLQKSSIITQSDNLSNTDSQIKPEVSNPPKPRPKRVTCKVGSCLQDNNTSSQDVSLRRKEREYSPTSSCPLDISCFCNYCNTLINKEHFHCSICDDGDYDLCLECVDNGTLCHGEGHWLIKRLIKDGKAVNSTTETIASNFRIQPKEDRNLSQNSVAPALTRTCNCCIQEDEFVTCTTCLDYDLCIFCHINMKHGHHPNHAFEAVDKNKRLDALARNLLAPGRHVKHDAICDGCKKTIYGIRHKCFDCPEWDYCSSCILNAGTTHPHHSFFPIYETSDTSFVPGKSQGDMIRHSNIFCDGPLCKNKSSYITGNRYKCAICDDFDLCANCEASPANTHNPTHPLIKFKTPVRHVSVTAQSNFKGGQLNPIVGDNRDSKDLTPVKNSSAQQIKAATQVQTIFDFKPLNTLKSGRTESKTNQATLEVTNSKITEASVLPLEPLAANFVSDVIVDGTIMLPDVVFAQTWYICNPGKTPWPKGCYIKFVGGTQMSVSDSTHHESLQGLVSTRDSMSLDCEVTYGQTISFTLSMKSPSCAGNFISHWRLATPNHRIFGPNLWCDITVKPPEQHNSFKTEMLQSECVGMIFPKLKKEEPSKVIYSQTSSKIDTHEDDFDDITEESIEDFDNVELFVTDDEYDILDASDEDQTS